MSYSSHLRAVAVSAALLVSAAAVVAGIGPALASQASGAASGTTAIAGTSASEAVVRSRQVKRRTVGSLKLSAPVSTSYAFGSLLDGKPIRWDPCTPIRWSSNTGRAPAGGLSVLKSAVATVAAQTGTTWTYVGATSTVPRAGYLPTSARAAYPPVLIGWTDGASSDLLAQQSQNVLGMARTAWFGLQRADGTRVAAMRAAVVALDATDRLPLTGPVSWNAVALHELSHAMGLGHTSDPTQLLAPVLPRTVASLQAGDKAGLTRIGRSAGCVTVS